MIWHVLGWSPRRSLCAPDAETAKAWPRAAKFSRITPEKAKPPGSWLLTDY